jgi:AraC family transcriptional regulator
MVQQRLSTREDYSRRVNIVVEYINNHLGDNIDLETLAKISNFSPYHFHRIMKAFLGEPIGAFISRMRIETAARLLRYTDMPVQDIAYRVGYDIPSSLSKIFKLFYGITPIDYRNNKTYTIMKPVTINSNLDLEEEVVNIEPKHAIYIRLLGDYKKNDYCLAWQKLWNYVRASNLFSPEMEKICNDTNKSDIIKRMLNEGKIEHIIIYYDDPNVTESDKLRADVCLTTPTEINPKGEIGSKQIEGGKYATFLYTGPYDNLSDVYDTIYCKYLPESEFQLAPRPGFEVYLNDPKCTAPEKLQTKIYVPIS